MFVLTETHKAVQNSDDPYMGTFLFVCLVLIIAVWIYCDIKYKKG